jgi:hypothetical protein
MIIFFSLRHKPKAQESNRASIICKILSIKVFLAEQCGDPGAKIGFHFPRRPAPNL